MRPIRWLPALAGLIGLAVWSGVGAAPARKVTDIRVTVSQAGEQVTVLLSPPPTGEGWYTSGTVEDRQRPRCFIDIADARPAPGLPVEMQAGGVLARRVRIGRNTPSSVRVVVDLLPAAEGVCCTVRPLPKGVLIDVAGPSSVRPPSSPHLPAPVATPVPKPAPPPAPRPAVPEAVRPPATVSPDPLSDLIRTRAAQPKDGPRTAPPPEPFRPSEGGTTVVIDPGHGGNDQGAPGPCGIVEKDVVLEIARLTAAILGRSRLVGRVVMTRTDDRSLELLERTELANREQAALFVSIHANASPKHEVQGVETYYLNNNTDRYAVRLAERENRTSGRSIGDLQFILADLAMNLNVDDSIDLAGSIQRSLVERLDGHYPGVIDRGVQNALFFVLLYARMPAVLVETAFISNDVECRRLKNPVFRDHIAIGIAAGIEAFLVRGATSGNRPAEKKP